MLSPDERAELDRRGFLRIRGVLDGHAVGCIADSVWTSFAKRGVDRTDPTTWPAGFIGKLQGLRQARLFDVFATERVSGIVDQLLGAGLWDPTTSWGPALITFPQPGPWVVPHAAWHFDLPARGDPVQPGVVRLFGYVSDVGRGGGGTVVVEGSHELVRRMVLSSPNSSAGRSADLRKRLVRRHPWFRELCTAGDGDRTRRLMVDGDEIDGVQVKVVELTADAGDVVVMLPWTMHSLAPNCAPAPRFMVTHSIYRSAGRASA